MKRNIKLLILCIIPALFAGCEPEKITDEEILSSRPTTVLDVKYTFEGREVQSLSFSSAPANYPIEVSINDENLRWTLESDRDWCTVESDGNKGPGSVMLKISANESFDTRDAATLTFVAGEFRGFKLKVDQRAAAFIISQPFTVSSLPGTAYSCNVTTQSGVSWDYNADGWLSVTRGEPKTYGENVSTPLQIVIAPNSGASRFGRVHLTAGSETSDLCVFQFGNEYEYDSDGRMMLPGSESRIDIIAPRFIVSDLELPAYASYTISDSGDDLSVVSIVLSENFNDCSETRITEAKLFLANGSAAEISLPVMIQDFLPAHGLVTAKGLQAFAEAVATGASTADWETGGVVTMKGDIDMSGVTGWTGIGTPEKPFTGSFDGGGYSVINLKQATGGLFNVCSGAKVSNVKLGKGCSIYNNLSYQEETWLGGIVNRAEGTVIERCELVGDVEFAGKSTFTPSDDEDFDEEMAGGADVYVGGIAGWCDESSSITSCKTSGRLRVTTGEDRSVRAYVGGIAGLCKGSLNSSEISGSLSFSSAIGTAYAGGIAALLPESAKVQGNAFMGTLTLGGSPYTVAMGGLYGVIGSSRTFDNASDKSVSQGTIEVKSYESGTDTRLYIGGFAGLASKDIDLSFKGYEVQTNFTLDRSVDRQLDLIAIGGVLGGCRPENSNQSSSIIFDSIGNKGSYSPTYAAVTSKLLHCFIGGVAGFVNSSSAIFRNCSNSGVLGRPATTVLTPSNTKNYTQVTGGIAGVVIGGDAEFDGCENKGAITNNHYSNVIPGGSSGGWWSACGSGGILGAFDYLVESVSGKLVMKDCTNGGTILNYRGMSGGIVAYARNAEITGCVNMGDLSTTNGNAAFKGGIACWLTQSSVSNCTAKCNVFCSNPASAVQSPGGILSISTGGGVSVTGCSYYGVLSVNKGDQPKACGGIVSTAEDDTVIKDCKFGGTIMNVVMSENNISDYVVGNGLGQVSGISYWSGN